MSVTNTPPDRDSIERTALVRGILESYVLKDWYIVQIIRIMAGISHDGFPLIFTGGTALSKGHHLIQRFSEDIDFRINTAPKANSEGARRHFRDTIVETLRAAGFKIEDDQIVTRNGYRFFSIVLNYESNFSAAPTLRPHIKLEFFTEKAQLPPVPLPIASFVNEFNKQAPEVPTIDCIHQVESAADKLSAITWRISDRIREEDDDDARTIVRHIHDLAMLKERALEHPAFGRLAAAAVQRDIGRPRNIPSFADMSLQEKFNTMLSILDQDAEYPREYSDFVAAMSYMRDVAPPDFAAATKAVRELVKIVGG